MVEAVVVVGELDEGPHTRQNGGVWVVRVTDVFQQRAHYHTEVVSPWKRVGQLQSKPTYTINQLCVTHGRMVVRVTDVFQQRAHYHTEVVSPWKRVGQLQSKPIDH